MAKALNGEKGFTYVEAMIVVIIIGLFTAMALPAFENIIAKERLKSTARTITIHLREVRQLAIATEQEIKVLFVTKDSYADEQKGNLYRVQDGTKILETVTLSHGIIINAVTFPSKTLQFKPLGTATSGRICLENPRGDKFYIIVNSVGRVRTSDIPPED